MRIRSIAYVFLWLALLGGFSVNSRVGDAVAQATNKPAVKKNDAVEKVILPYLTKHCVQCHGPKKKSAGLTLHTYTDEKSILKDRKKWHEVVRMVHSGEMPEAKQPSGPCAQIGRAHV